MGLNPPEQAGASNMPITTPRASLVSIRPRSILKIYLEAKKVVTPKILPSSEATDAPLCLRNSPYFKSFFGKQTRPILRMEITTMAGDLHFNLAASTSPKFQI